jgi:hypothetical protein
LSENEQNKIQILMFFSITMLILLLYQFSGGLSDQVNANLQQAALNVPVATVSRRMPINTGKGEDRMKRLLVWIPVGCLIFVIGFLSGSFWSTKKFFSTFSGEGLHV